MKKLLWLFLLIVIPVVVFAEEVVKKCDYLRSDYYNNSRLCIYYLNGKEVAREIYGLKGRVEKTIGTIPDGIVREYYPDGSVKWEANYKNGRIDGSQKSYYENGSLSFEGSFKNGVPDGIQRWHYPKGGLKIDSNYKNGKLEGAEKFYYDNGQLKQEKTFKEGQEIHLKRYDEKGNLLCDGNCRNIPF